MKVDVYSVSFNFFGVAIMLINSRNLMQMHFLSMGTKEYIKILSALQIPEDIGSYLYSTLTIISNVVLEDDLATT